MSYSMKNGKLAAGRKLGGKPSLRVLKFHVLVKVNLALRTDGQIDQVTLENSRIATRPEDDMSKDDLALIMANAGQLSEMTGVLLVEQQTRKKAPLVQLAPSDAK